MQNGNNWAPSPMRVWPSTTTWETSLAPASITTFGPTVQNGPISDTGTEFGAVLHDRGRVDADAIVGAAVTLNDQIHAFSIPRRQVPESNPGWSMDRSRLPPIQSLLPDVSDRWL